MLHAVRVEGFNLARVTGDDQLHQHFALGGEEETLQFVGVLQLDEGLGGRGGWEVVSGGVSASQRA